MQKSKPDPPSNPPLLVYLFIIGMMGIFFFKSYEEAPHTRVEVFTTLDIALLIIGIVLVVIGIVLSLRFRVAHHYYKKPEDKYPVLHVIVLGILIMILGVIPRFIYPNLTDQDLKEKQKTQETLRTQQQLDRVGHQISELENQKQKLESKTIPDIFKVVFFPSNSAQLTEEAKAEIGRFINYLENATLVVKGYADDTGSDAHNIALSQKRAQYVAEYIHTLKPHAITFKLIEGYGEFHPIVNNKDENNRAKNRRVSIEHFNKTNEKLDAILTQLEDSKRERDILKQELKVLSSGIEKLAPIEEKLANIDSTNQKVNETVNRKKSTGEKVSGVFGWFISIFLAGILTLFGIYERIKKKWPNLLRRFKR